MKKFQEILFKDFGWKLLSIAIATVLWFMVINIDQPIDTRAYNRPLVIENMQVLTDRGLAIGNLEELKNTKITVKVKAQRTALDRLNQNPEWITATVDLSDLSHANNGDIVSVPVSVSIQGGNTYNITSKTPAAVEISIETMASKELPVEVVLSGTLEDGTYLSTPLLSEEVVQITGPASLVETVAFVRANVDASDVQKTPDVMTELVCYTATGVPVKGVSTTPEEIMVSYALHDMKQVPLQVEISGTPAPGYQVTNITCNPRYAALIGDAKLLEDMLYLQLDSINVSGLSDSITQTFHLMDYLPEGMTLMAHNEGIVEVTVEISEQSQKQLTIPASRLKILGQEDGKTYSLHGDAHLTLTGEGSALDAVDAGDVQCSIHVSNLSAGDHRVMLHADLPNGLVLNPSYITVTVNDADASDHE